MTRFFSDLTLVTDADGTLVPYDRDVRADRV
jgi:hypothetical protein